MSSVYDEWEGQRIQNGGRLLVPLTKEYNEIMSDVVIMLHYTDSTPVDVRRHLAFKHNIPLTTDYFEQELETLKRHNWAKRGLIPVLHRKGFNQSQISDMLQISQQAVSYHLKHKHTRTIQS